jgi:hypothetical protein
MYEISLSLKELEILVTAIESYLSDLRMEITDTDSKDYREMLKERKDALAGILDSLQNLQKEPAVG